MRSSYCECVFSHGFASEHEKAFDFVHIPVPKKKSEAAGKGGVDFRLARIFEHLEEVRSRSLLTSASLLLTWDMIC